MASVTRLPNGKKAVQFDDHIGRRRTIRVGKLTINQAKRVGERLDCLANAKRMGTNPDPDTVGWLADIADDMFAKLVAYDLCEPRLTAATESIEPEAITIGRFIAEYLAMRSDVKPSTMRHLREAGDKLQAFFGADRAMAIITALDAEAYRLHLGKALGENTTRRMVSRARQFFAAAIRGRRVADNPFAHLKGLAVRSVKSRQAFIPREQIAKLLEAAPSAEWRAIIALARYGGIRVPSELFPLRWGDIDWEHNRLTITSPKTEHCGQGSRVVPLFAELRPWLEEAFDAAEPGSEYVVSKHRAPSENMRQGLLRLIRRAGLQAWPKLFVNLRASRATELAEDFPGHVAAAWLGHTEAVANEHYRQVTDEHYTRAASEPSGTTCSALQGALHQTAPSAAKSGNARHEPEAKNAKSPVIPGLAATCDYLLDCQGAPPGTRTQNPLIKSPRKTSSCRVVGVRLLVFSEDYAERLPVENRARDAIW
jgi:integrase